MIALLVVAAVVVVAAGAYLLGRRRPRIPSTQDGGGRYVVYVDGGVIQGDSLTAARAIEGARVKHRPWVLYVDGVEKKRGS